MKFAVLLIGWYGGSKYIRSPFLASSKTASKPLHEILIFSDCRILLTAVKFSLLTIFGFVYRPRGTLNLPFLFTRYSPLNKFCWERLISILFQFVALVLDFLLHNNIQNRIAEIVLQRGELYCELCEAKDCHCIGYVWSIPEIYEKLNSKGLRNHR